MTDLGDEDGITYGGDTLLWIDSLSLSRGELFSRKRRRWVLIHTTALLVRNSSQSSPSSVIFLF